MFHENSSINVFDLKRDLIIVKLGSLNVVSTKGDNYRNAYAVCKLLSVNQIRRIDTVVNDTPVVHDALEESIVKECLIDIIGIKKEDIDFDKSDAGIVTRIANAVIVKSISNVNNPLEHLNKLSEQISFIETVGAIVSRYMNISYLEVLELPINIVLRYFSICQKAFGSEIKIDNGSNESDYD